MSGVAGAVEVRADVIPFGDVLDEMPRSASEQSDVGVLFVELAQAHSLAIGRSPREVGAIMGTFFKTVGEVTDGSGGYSERHDLCAVLCMFEGPASSTRAADAALGAGRHLRDRLVEELPEVAFRIGISVGASVAGWIQATRRFEPRSICAPESEARRLCELARRDGQSLVASERALVRASSAEAGLWSSATRGGATWRVP